MTRSSCVALLSGPNATVVVVGHAGLVRGGLLDECGDQLVVNRRGREDPRRRGAVLTGVEVAGHRDGLGRRRDVGVVEDDDRRLAAELEMDALQVARRRLRDLECRHARCR